MCLAIPGKIIKIKKDIAFVDYKSEKRKAKIIEGEFKIGDYALVQGGLLIEKIPKKQAEDWLRAFRE